MADDNDWFSDEERNSITFLIEKYMYAATRKSVIETHPTPYGRVSVAVKQEHENDIVPRLEQLGIRFTVRHEKEEQGSSWSHFELQREGLAKALQGMFASLNDERRDKFENALMYHRLNGAHQLRNPLDGRWLNTDVAARYFAEKLEKHEQDIKMLKGELRGDESATDLSLKVAALRKSDRGIAD